MQNWESLKVIKKPLDIARFFVAQKVLRMVPNSSLIGVAGTVGKTLTSEICFGVLKNKFEAIYLDGNLPSQVFKIRPKIKKIILELSEQSPDYNFLINLKPQTVIVTRISTTRNNVGSSLDKVKENFEALITQLSQDATLILNWDDLNVRQLSNATRATITYYGTEPKECHVWASNIQTKFGKTYFELNHGVERVEVILNLLGHAGLYAALAAATLGIENKLSLFSIKKALESIPSLPRRLFLQEGLEEWLVLDDSYDSTPIGIEDALNVLNELPARHRFFVFSDTKDLAAVSEELYRRLAQKLFKDKTVNYVILGGGDTGIIEDELSKLGFGGKVESNLSNSQMVAKILSSVGKGDIVLVSGTRSTRMDEVVKRITKQFKS